jgi:hypothetical protein
MTKKRILGCLRVPPVAYHWYRVKVKVKGKAVPLHAMEALGGEEV